MPKITQLTTDTAPTSDDLTVIVNDPAGTPGTKKATLANVITKAHGLTDGIVSAGSGTLNTTLSLDTDGTLAANSDTKIASQKATKTYADNVLGNANALVYKGVIDCSTNPNYPAANAGELYVVSVAGKIGGASGIDVEVGDMVICNTDGTASGNQATVGQYWNIIQKNIVGAVTGPASAVTDNIAVFDGTTGKIIKDSGAKTSDFITKALIDAKGDLIVGSAADTPAILTSSAVNGNVLTVDTSTATGLKWAAPASGGQILYDIVVAPSGGDYTTLTAALAAATAGQTIFVRSGTYTETQAYNVSITTANLHIIGENRASTILQFANNYGIIFTGTNVVFENIRVECGNTNSIIRFNGARNYINNCYFYLQATSASSYQFSIAGDYTKLTNCYLETTSTTQAQLQAIISLGSVYGVVENNVFDTRYTTNTTDGTIRVGGSYITISNNYFRQPSTTQNSGQLMVTNGADYGQILGNIIETATDSGYQRGDAIRVNGTHWVINNNQFKGASYNIYSSASRVTVVGNYFAGGSYGLYINNGNDAEFASNLSNVSGTTFHVANGSITFSCIGNFITNSGGNHSIYISGNSSSSSVGSIISGNRISAPSNVNAIEINNYQNAMILNNVIQGGSRGIYIQSNSHGCYIANNYIKASNNYGIENIGGTGVVIHNNRIDGTNSRGIYNNQGYCTIKDNLIADDTDINNTSVTSSVYDNRFIYDNAVAGNAKNAKTLVNESKTILMKNTSGGQLVAGDVVILKSTANCDEITTTTTAGDDKVFGMVAETIADTAIGTVLVKGKTTLLKVNGTTDIAIGDFLTTYTAAGIAAKAAAGDTVFAIALEAYTADDSLGVIDALLIPPRLI